MPKAIVITPDAKVTIKELANYDAIRTELNGGWLEALYPCVDVVAYIDEEGKLKNLPANPLATGLMINMLAETGRILIPGDYICGNIIFLGIKETDDGRDDDNIPEAFVTKWFQGLVK